MRALFLVIDLVLELYIWILIAAAIFSWLVAFNVVNVRNSVVGMIGDRYCIALYILPNVF